jgi:hypothetical protein
MAEGVIDPWPYSVTLGAWGAAAGAALRAGRGRAQGLAKTLNLVSLESLTPRSSCGRGWTAPRSRA